MLLTTDPRVYGLNQNMLSARSPLFCGCISPRFGCALACAVWLILDVYIAALAFQGYTPVFSFLTKPALYTLAGISTFFAIISLLLLAGLLLKSIGLLRFGLGFLLICVFLFIIDVLASIIIFGVKYTDYNSWCTSMSAGLVDEKVAVSFVNGTKVQFEYTPSPNSANDLYNCNKLWEDEIKLGIAVWFVIIIAYIYWTGCIYKYYQSLEILIPQGHAQMPFPSFSSFPSFPSMGMHRIWRRPPFMQAMHNHPPSSV